MTPKTIRIFKEARSLFWPWLAVITAAALPLLERSWSAGSEAAPLWGIHQVIEPASFLGFFIGLPLLATLSLGNEFQCRTIPLLLSQPLGRTEIWSEKIIVSLVADLSAASLFYIAGRNVLQQDPAIWTISAAKPPFALRPNYSVRAFRCAGLQPGSCITQTSFLHFATFARCILSCSPRSDSFLTLLRGPIDD
jgi:hypothetical protein